MPLSLVIHVHPILSDHNYAWSRWVIHVRPTLSNHNYASLARHPCTPTLSDHNYASLARHPCNPTLSDHNYASLARHPCNPTLSDHNYASLARHPCTFLSCCYIDCVAMFWDIIYNTHSWDTKYTFSTLNYKNTHSKFAYNTNPITETLKQTHSVNQTHHIVDGTQKPLVVIQNIQLTRYTILWIVYNNNISNDIKHCIRMEM